MKTKSFKTLVDRFEYPAGTVVYECVNYDYGCASEDTRETGIRHISVTESPTGDYPFFTIAVDDLESIDD